MGSGRAILRNALHGCPLNRLMEMLILSVDIGRTKASNGGGNAPFLSSFDMIFLSIIPYTSLSELKFLKFSHHPERGVRGPRADA